MELRNRRSHRTQIRRDVEVTHEPTAVQELVRRVCDRRVHRCVIARVRLGRTRGGRQIHVWLVGDGEPLGGGQGRVVGKRQLRGGPLVAHFGGHHPRALFESQRGLQRFPIDDDAWLVVTVHGDLHVWELRGEDAEELREGLGAPVVGAGENVHFAGCDGEAGDAGGTGVFADEAADERAELERGDRKEGTQVIKNLVEVIKVVDGAFTGEDVPLERGGLV